MGGFTAERFAEFQSKASRDDVPNNMDQMQEVNAGTQNQKSEGKTAYSTLVSYLGRVMYNYDNRYYLTASIRADGSSRFPKGNKYAIFPSVSASWRIISESFMQDQKIFSNLKLRGGWGRVGNQNIDNDATLTLLGQSDYVFGTAPGRVSGTMVSGVGNNLLKWETVEDWNVGVDMSFLDSRLDMTFEYFQKKSSDMLYQKQNIFAIGYPDWNSTVWMNIGSMKASGWELSLNWHDKVADFRYNVGLNLSAVKNKAVKFSGDGPIQTGGFNSDQIIRNEDGGLISRFYGYVADGIFQNWDEVYAHTNENGKLVQSNAQPGDIRFKDLNHDGVLDENDKTWIGNPYPDLMVGLNLGFSYKNIDFTANFYGTFGKDTLTIETVTGDVTITAKARKIGGDPFVLGDLTYRITRDAAVEVAGVKEDAYTKGRSYVIPSSLEYEGNNYAVAGIGPKAFSGRIMESITIPSSVEEVGTESFLDAQADEIHIQRSTSPSTVNGSFNILDKNKCRIYVPKGALAAYHTATWDWLGFPYILEEGDKYFDVDFELTGLTVKPFQPEIAISGRSVSFILVPDSGSFLPDSIEVWYPTGLEPCEYDAKTGKVTIATVKGNLTIKAKAIGALLPDKDTDITIGKDSTYTDGSTTGSKFNGVIGNDEELTRVKSLKIDTEDGKVTGITFKSLIVGSGSSTSQSVTIAETSNIEITLDGNNNLGKVLNQGSTRLLPGENTLLDALVENEGVFIDETGLLDAITGPAGLTIAQRPEKAPRIEIGSSTLLKVEASAEGEANLSYIWEKFDSENNSWKQVKPEVQRTKALSSLRSDVLSTNEDTQLEVSEAGKYRCLVSNTVNAVNSTLTAYSEVSIASSTPDPTVTFSVTLPSVEGAALSPLAGTYSVEAGGSFSFSLTLDTDCDQSTPMVKVGDKLIEPTSDGKYEIKNINSDITISITGIVKNATVGNAEVESNALKIWGSNGVLHIQSAHVSTAYIMTFVGQLYKALTLPIGETMITIPQGAYIIRIENQSYKIRF